MRTGLGPAPDYWTIVARQFRKRRSAVAAGVFVGALFLVAIFAPFLAGDRPLVMATDDGLSFPVLSHLDGGDLAWLLGLVSAGLALAVHALLRRRDRTRPAVGQAFLTFVVVQALGTLLLVTTARNVADRTDWPAVAERATAAGRTLVLPPIPFDPDASNVLRRLTPRGRDAHLLGTDSVGRDIGSRMVWGTRVSLVVGFVAVSIAISIGVVVGSLAGFFGGRVDMVLSRLVEVVQCFPSFFLILAVLAFLPPSIFNVMMLIGITGWTGVARLTRGEVLRLRSQDFVSAGRALGASSARLIFRHVLPNALAPVLVSATFGIAGAILTEAGLSFLGFGVPPPTSSWGSLLYDARSFTSSHPWMAFYPGLAIFLTVTAYNLVGEGLRDALDPRLTR